jgi:acetyl esterase/lipase
MGPGTPLVVFFYGGRWQAGRKEDFLFAAEAFVSRGFAVAVPDTRLYPEVRFPVFLQDAAAAVAWLARKGARHRLPAEGGPVVLAGHSSGAHIATMLALDERWLAAAGAPRPAGLLGLAVPYDFLPLRDADLRDIFHADRAPAGLPATQPIVHADPGDPPAALASAGARRRYPPTGRFPRQGRSSSNNRAGAPRAASSRRTCQTRIVGRATMPM